MTFLSELARLREAATKDPHIGTYSELRKFLGNHSEAIEELVRAVSEEHGGNHHEPECPICVALAKFNDAGEK